MAAARSLRGCVVHLLDSPKGADAVGAACGCLACIVCVHFLEFLGSRDGCPTSGRAAVAPPGLQESLRRLEDARDPGQPDTSATPEKPLAGGDGSPAGMFVRVPFCI